MGAGSALSTGVALDVTSLSLPPGHWSVYGSVGGENFGSSMNLFGFSGWIGTVSATESSAYPTAHYVGVTPVTVLASGLVIQPVGQAYIHNSGTANISIYLSMVAYFSGGGGFGAGGAIVAIPVDTVTP